jgi:hypothetical protein
LSRRRPTRREAAQALLRLSVDIELQLQQRSGGAPLAHHLKRSRERALDAVYALASVEPTDAEAIRRLQMQFKMHEALLDDMKEIVAKGREAEDYLDSEEAEDIAQAIGLDMTEEGTTPDEDIHG